jgi:uncharacterized membrane protein YfcA
MEYILISLVAFGTAMLTFFSGFGLGTILMPVFALFFPLDVAIGLTAIVHLSNNLFKIVLVRKDINLKVSLLFGIPAAAFAFLGALTLNALNSDVVLAEYALWGKNFAITPINLVIAILLMLFAIVELSKKLSNFSLPKKFLPFGGALSGFFGGFSGHQGALRTMFLMKSGLSKESFIATGIAAAVLIDISRLTVYGTSFIGDHFSSISDNRSLIMIIVAVLSAFIGSILGRKLLKKVTLRSVQIIVGVLIFVFAVFLGLGII